jgi:hypothetical protein
MSTVSTHLNWGSSYVVDDFYRRFVAPSEDEKRYVAVGRISTLILIVLSSGVALWLENALQAFTILLQIGAGTGLVFLLRWFWWRINAWSEISAMIISFLIAFYFQFVHGWLGYEPVDASLTLVIGVALTSVGWITVTLLTPPDDEATLKAFYAKIRPIGHGWRKIVGDEAINTDESISAPMLGWFLGCVLVYGALFGTGMLLYGETAMGLVMFAVAAGSAYWMFKILPKINFMH